jgi:hypothetical protein
MEIMGHVFDVKTLLINGLKGSPTALIPIAIKIISSRSKKDKHLTIETTRRGIILEHLENLPFSIIDDDGNSIYNCYSIQFRIWNKGKEVIRGQDISQSEPFILEISNGARVLGSPFIVFRDPDDIGLTISDLENGKFKIDFEFINSDEWLEVCFYVTGNPNAKASASGRIAGQKSPGFDVSIDDGRASLGERLYSLVGILFIISLPMSLGIGLIWLLWLLHDYSLQSLWLEPKNIPDGLFYLLVMGFSFPLMYLIYFVFLWIARKSHPKTYPLEVDYRPKPFQHLLAYWNVFWKGKNFLISNSSYNYGEIFVPNQEEN